MPICSTCGRRYNDAFQRCSEDGSGLAPDTTPLTLAPGTTLAIGVTIRHFVGAGPTGEVYAAERQGHIVAVKLLSREITSDPVAHDRLTRLQTHLHKVHHPGVARALALGDHEGYRVLARELVPGRSASDLVLHTGPIQPIRAIGLALRAAEALTEAHRNGALHLNLRPSNLFVLDGDLVKLVDFGVAQRLSLERGTVHGDPHYLAPEQYEGKLVSFRSDIFGLGCLLYYLLTGRAPHYDNPAVYAGPVGVDPPLPSSLVPGLGGHTKIDQLVLRAIQHAPNKRYLSVQHFGRVMDGMLEELHASFGTISTRRPAQTLRIGELLPPESYHPHPPQQQATVSASPRLEERADDTVRMVMPPPRLVQGSRGHRPLDVATKPMAYARTHDTIREPVRAADGAGYQGPMVSVAERREEHDTVRVVVAPPPAFAPAPAQARAQHTFPAPGAAGAAPDDIEIVAEEPVDAPPKRRRKKRKKPQDPIVAVRGEAAFRLEVGRFVEETPHGDSVMVEDDLLAEARGPQRNLETMEIRIVPPVREERQASRSLGKVGQVVIAVAALLVIFVLAAVGAAALARWLSAAATDDPHDRIEAPHGGVPRPIPPAPQPR
jgi:serine/threonine protein kinase